MSRADGTVFVDINAMNTWKSNINDITSKSNSILSAMTSDVTSLNDSWEGGSATGFIESYTAFLKELTESHAKLANFGNLLEAVVQTMERE